jgi:putative redox protein
MATKIKIKNLPEGFQSVITNGRHTLVGDEPIPSKGTDLGMSPTELVLSGLTMCKVATVRFVARRKGWDSLIRDVYAETSMEVKRGEGRSLRTVVQVNMTIEGDLSPEQRAELLQEADNCYVHRMIMGDWDIDHATAVDGISLHA